MDCNVYCTAASYNIKALFKSLRGRYTTTYFRDLIHVEIPHGEDKMANAFLFQHGTTVLWDAPKEKENLLLSEIKDFELQSLKDNEIDNFDYLYGNSLKIAEDVITLPDRGILTKLAVSHGLAQSVKLGTFETAIQKIFNHTQNLPEYLARRGRIYLSKREIRKKMGELFLERNSINLHANVLDVPEFFWETPEYEPIYMNVAKYLDIESRVEVLNQRLSVVHELFQMLGSELNHQHSCRLEWGIIILIVIEVSLTLLRDVFHWL